jgi:hypothetical protein
MQLVSLICGMLSVAGAIAGGIWLSANSHPDARADARLVLYVSMVLGVIAIALGIFAR